MSRGPGWGLPSQTFWLSIFPILPFLPYRQGFAWEEDTDPGSTGASGGGSFWNDSRVSHDPRRLWEGEKQGSGRAPQQELTHLDIMVLPKIQISLNVCRPPDPSGLQFPVLGQTGLSLVQLYVP